MAPEHDSELQYLLFENPRPDLNEVFHRIAAAHKFYLKFLSANDLGLTGTNQAGIYLSRDSWPLFFDAPGKNEENLTILMPLIRSDGPPVEAAAHWYGTGSRSEYRLTRITDLFRNHEDSFLGSLLLITLESGERRIWIFNDTEDIDAVLNFLGISPTETGSMKSFDLEERASVYFSDHATSFTEKFPDSETIAGIAQSIFAEIFGVVDSQPLTARDPDRDILHLISIEYSFFRYLENRICSSLSERKFHDIEDLIATALPLINRRKSRAGRSLELHLKFILDRFSLSYSYNEVTEGTKRPDFVFPSIAAYHDPSYEASKLFFLGAKTTCKDRWRQILNEANRIIKKHLFTLQQGISSAQISEMKEVGVVLVVPTSYHNCFHPDDRKELMSLAEFIALALKVHDSQIRMF